MALESETNVNKIKKNITSIYDRRRVVIYALALRYAAATIKYFRQMQSGNVFWENRTTTAMRTMFTRAFIDQGDMIGFFMSHMVEYGPYLELANNRQNEAIRPTMIRFGRMFLEDVKKLYGEAA